jgi:hypothetical protein
MGKFFDSMMEHVQDFIRAQHVFFVGSAPLSAEGHVNISPKGLDSFRILSSNKVAYLDLTGSGNETSAHLEENGRITLMFCAFDGPPNVVRLFGQGRTVVPTMPEWDELSVLFPTYPGIRQIIMVEVTRVGTSCGYAVPFFEYQGERETLFRWAEKKGDDGLEKYRHDKNRKSMDGLPTTLAFCETE